VPTPPPPQPPKQVYLYYSKGCEFSLELFDMLAGIPRLADEIRCIDIEQRAVQGLRYTPTIYDGEFLYDERHAFLWLLQHAQSQMDREAHTRLQLRVQQFCSRAFAGDARQLGSNHGTAQRLDPDGRPLVGFVPSDEDQESTATVLFGGQAPAAAAAAGAGVGSVTGVTDMKRTYEAALASAKLGGGVGVVGAAGSECTLEDRAKLLERERLLVLEAAKRRWTETGSAESAAPPQQRVSTRTPSTEPHIDTTDIERERKQRLEMIERARSIYQQPSDASTPSGAATSSSAAATSWQPTYRALGTPLSATDRP
ncbi:Hypothetical protein UVM_LOCUS502, partial [uncultured virus]